MTHALISISLTLFSLCTSADENRVFPLLSGETLTNETLTIPDDTKGKYTIVGMGFSQKAEENMSTWYDPMYNKFVAKSGIWDKQYDVNFYFVPMFTGAKKAAYKSTMKKLQNSNRKDLFPYILFYKGDMKPYEEPLGLKEKKKPYLFVLDKEGRIVFETNGVYTEDKLYAIEEHIEQ